MPLGAYRIFGLTFEDPDQAVVTRPLCVFDPQPASNCPPKPASKDRSEGTVHPHWSGIQFTASGRKRGPSIPRTRKERQVCPYLNDCIFPANARKIDQPNVSWGKATSVDPLPFSVRSAAKMVYLVSSGCGIVDREHDPFVQPLALFLVALIFGNE